jgi:hypothetical protein
MGLKYKSTGLLIRFALNALIDLRQEKKREETGEGTRLMWTKGRGEAVVVIEEVNEAIEIVRVIDTGTGTENAVVKEMAKEPTAVTDMMVQMADMVTGIVIVIAKGTEMTIVSAGAREGTTMRDPNGVRTIELKEKNQNYLTIYWLRLHPHPHRLKYRHPHLVVVLRLTEETAKSTTNHQEAGMMVAVMPMMMI